MRLSSARDAKFEFMQELARGISVAAGITPRPTGQFALALRAQAAAGPGAQVVADWAERYGNDVDVRVIGMVRKQSIPWYRQRIRPVVPGASVSHVDVSAGTIGSFVRRPSVAGPAAELLSNNHVLADENKGAIGDPILQPGAFDGGTVPGDVIGTLAAFVPVATDGANVVDCALSSIDDEVGWSLSTFDDEGGLIGVYDVTAGDDDGAEFPAVVKFGRTTGRTGGTITAIELDNLRVQYDVGVVRFDDQIEVQGTSGPFSQGGDSGSLVITTAATDPNPAGGARAVGLLFAGSDTGGPNGGGLTYVNPITVVLAELDADLVLSPGG